MIVFLKELKIKTITDFTSQDGLKLLESLSLHCIPILHLKAFQNFLGEVLILIIEHIECDLISNKVIALLLITR